MKWKRVGRYVFLSDSGYQISIARVGDETIYCAWPWPPASYSDRVCGMKSLGLFAGRSIESADRCTGLLFIALPGESGVIVDEYLEVWSKWSRNSAGDLGYKRTTVIGRMVRDGGPIIRLDRKSSVFMSENLQAERMDSFVSELRGKYRDPGRAIIQKYSFYDPNEACARRLGVSLATFKSWLNMGRYWLEGRLSVID